MSAAAVPAAVKERGIIFSAPGSVAGILAATKSQTRRLVRLPDGAPWRLDQVDGDGAWFSRARFSRANRTVMGVEVVTECWGIPCPYGVPGDRLWVRETWRISSSSSASCHSPRGVHFRADPDEVSGGPWRSPYHMPRWASRLTLEVTGVSVQRLQEISAEDARAEGGPVGEMLPASINGVMGQAMAFDPRIAFAWAWDSINGKRAPWKSNPWVWCLTFKRVA